jgi:CheY-like chemotaxis protein
MDIRMPVMDGLTATRAIRELDLPRAAEVPIVAMTASAFEEDIRESFSAGMNAHLAKPFGPRELYQVMERFLKVGAR